MMNVSFDEMKSILVKERESSTLDVNLLLPPHLSLFFPFLSLWECSIFCKDQVIDQSHHFVNILCYLSLKRDRFIL